MPRRAPQPTLRRARRAIGTGVMSREQVREREGVPQREHRSFEVTSIELREADDGLLHFVEALVTP